jgi:4-hydroxy-3-polyprenylbenzoate decarboxylase
LAVESAFVGITGASGAPYAVRLIEVLSEIGVEVEVCASEMGEKVLAYEMGGLNSRKIAERYGVRRYAHDDLFAPPASGTSVPDATVIAPASVSTLGHVANGTGTNLLHRVADVALKERRRLVILEREMPYSRIHLQNMLAVTDAGGIIVSAAPGFYNHPKSLDDLVDFVVGKTLDTMGVDHTLVERWGSNKRRERE